MPRKSNPLLGRGENLTGGVEVPRGGSEKNPPYDFARARTRVSSLAETTVRDLAALPEAACPGGEAVAVLTMHPRYISKSDFPSDLIAAMGGRAIGSRSRLVKPENWGVKKHPDEAMADEYFIAAPRKRLRQWAGELSNVGATAPGAVTLQQVEDLRAFTGAIKLRSIPSGGRVMLEVALHSVGASGVLRSFSKYVESLGGEVLDDHRVDARGLTFVPVRIAPEVSAAMADFSYVRVARGMPQLRPYRPPTVRTVDGFVVAIPSLAVQSTDARAVIFDGGIPETFRALLAPAVTLIEPEGIGEPVASLEAHGMAVTSAFLFGSLRQSEAPPPPICPVTHVRVLDKATGTDRDVLYLDVLNRIIDHLDAHGDEYRFINISLGPDLAVEDDEVTAWTALLDERLAGGTQFATVAVGNSGELDRDAGLCRIQPPADGVNLISVGACTRAGAGWRRAEYSSVGPGRTPGRVKPDGVAFGGCDDEPFYVLARPAKAVGTTGTSFSAPLTLRTAAAVSLGLGEPLGVLALRALTIHRAERHDTETQEDIGWGRFELDPEMLSTCDDDEAIIVYQGELPISEHLRCALPMPDGALNGPVHVSATLVISPEVDPNNPSTYTRSGLEVFFRPNAGRFRKIKKGEKAPKHAQTKPFFSLTNLYGGSEVTLRGDAHKWEACLSRSQKFMAKTLNGPVFDVYYHHRSGGTKATDAKPIPYALIVGLKAPKMSDFYDRVVRAYSGVLVQMKPEIDIRIR